jgi:hypothetical protein
LNAAIVRFEETFAAAIAAQLLDGLASDLPARLLIELQLLGANMHPAQCLRECVAHEFGAGSLLTYLQQFASNILDRDGS